jgi:hypothetical protein
VRIFLLQIYNGVVAWLYEKYADEYQQYQSNFYSYFLATGGAAAVMPAILVFVFRVFFIRL